MIENNSQTENIFSFTKKAFIVLEMSLIFQFCKSFSKFEFLIFKSLDHYHIPISLRWEFTRPPPRPDRDAVEMSPGLDWDFVGTRSRRRWYPAKTSPRPNWDVTRTRSGLVGMSQELNWDPAKTSSRHVLVCLWQVLTRSWQCLGASPS
jgi:hypothetical protein